MPSTVYTSPSLNARGLALVSQSVQEQISGLVNVSVEYVTTATRRDLVASMFYLDAPPPIFPDCVNRFELQNRALYMVTRNITQANGLVTINAEYAGGLRRGGSPPLLITTERDGPNGYFFQSAQETLTITRFPFAPDDYDSKISNITAYVPSESLSYYSIVYEYTFVDIDGLRPELPALGELYNIIAYRKTVLAVRVGADGQSFIADLSSDSSKPELAGNSGEFGLPYFTNYLERIAINIDEKPTYITPTVKMVTIRKYIN